MERGNRWRAQEQKCAGLWHIVSRKDPFFHSKKTENSCSFRGALFLRNLGILDFYLTQIVFLDTE